jgi:hypothetical protein
MDAFNVVVGIIGLITGIFGVIFSVWVSIKTNYKIHEMAEAMETIYDISDAAVWEWQTAFIESDVKRLQLAEKTFGNMNDISRLSSRYMKSDVEKLSNKSGGQLIERGIIWNSRMILDVEMRDDTLEIWLVTPDLQPDLSDESTGKLVYNNIKKGKRYVFFYPNNLRHINDEIAQLKLNIGIKDTRSKLAQQISLIALDSTKHSDLFSRGNILLCFRDRKRGVPPRCFEEVVLTQITERGSFWQEHSEAKSKEIWHLLEPHIE